MQPSDDVSEDPAEWGPAEYDDACATDEAYQACLDIVAHRMDLRGEDVVLDMAAGTGGFALAVAPHVTRVHARDPEPEWLAYARAKAAEAGVENVTFAEGSLADPRLPEPATVVVAAFVLHHVLDEEGPEGLEAAARALAATGARRLILPDYYSKDARSPVRAPLPHVEQALERAGYSLTGVEWFGEDVAVVAADRDASE